MDIRFGERGMLYVDNAALCMKNFSGGPTRFNSRGGVREFGFVIPTREIANDLYNDKNMYGVGWNVKMLEARDEGDAPFMFLKVKVRFNKRGPKVYLVSGGKRRELNEENISILDNIDIAYADIDIRPYDDIHEGTGKPFRSAQLSEIVVYQNLGRISARFAEEEYPEE